MIDFDTLKRLELRLAVDYDAFDRAWHAVIHRNDATGVTVDIADEDPNAAIAAAFKRYVEEMEPCLSGCHH